MVSINVKVLGLLVVVAALLELSCTASIPPVPAVPLDGLDADIRSTIQKARDEALAQPKDGRATGHLGMMLQAHSLFQPAVLAYQRAIRLEPKEFSWRYYLALSLEKTGQLDQALAAVSDALRIRRDYAPAVLKRGELLLQLSRFQESGAVLEPEVAQNPSSALALYDLGRVKFAQQDFAAAADLYRRACQAYPTFGSAWFGLAETSKRLGRTAETEKDYQLAENYKDQSPPAEDVLLAQVMKLATGIENRLMEAKRLMDGREFDGAAQIYKEVLKQHPDNLDCLVNLLYMAQYQNQTLAEVEDLYARARAASPQLPQVYLYYGTALAAQGRFDAAAGQIDKAIQLKPDDPEAHSWLADVRERQHRPADAIEQYRLALQVQPSFRPARLELGKILMELGRNREAIPVLLPATQLEDSYTTVVMMLLGYAYLSTGDRENAKEYLTQAHVRALKTGPPNLVAHIEQGLRSLGSG